MDTRSWLRAVADHAPWGVKHGARLMGYTDHISAAWPAGRLSEDRVRPVATRLRRFPSLSELMEAIAAEQPDGHDKLVGDRQATRTYSQADRHEALLRERLEDGVDVSLVLSLARRYAEEGVWDRLAADFAPELLSAELQTRRERAQRHGHRSSPPAVSSRPEELSRRGRDDTRTVSDPLPGCVAPKGS